jgi:predicted Zn-dependent protease
MYFSKLYDQTKDLVYAHEAIRSYGLYKDFKNLKSILDQAIEDYPKDLTLKRFLAAYYLDNKEYKKADEILKTLPQKSDADKALFATTQLGLGNPQKALSYYKEKYKNDKSSKNAVALFDILYSLKRDDEALQVLQNHADFVSCDEIVCYKLIAIYKDRNDVDKIITITKRLYQKTSKASYANMLLELYRYKDDKKSAISFLKKSGFNDLILLDLYLSEKNYKDAKKLAQKLYDKNGDLNILAQLSMIEYESALVKDKKLLKKITSQFDKVIKKIDNPLYNNFYGYILIDDDIDVDKGIKLVKKALLKRPKSDFFIDSLAWGYFKKGQCQKALDTITPIAVNSDEKEIIKHYKIIKECR